VGRPAPAGAAEPGAVMTADEALTAKLAGRLGWVCRACGLIEATRVLVHQDAARRLAGLACECGNRLVTFDPPAARVPFGRQAGEWLDEADVGMVEWLHRRDVLNPWTMAACCELLGCEESHALTWTAYHARLGEPRRRRRDATRARPRFPAKPRRPSDGVR
jgi:hypothetical protein